jgi:hypothetical protein
MRVRSIAMALSAAVLLAAPSAFADRVALLPSHGGANADPRAALDSELGRALTALGHTVIPANAAAAGVLDGVADTPEEYRQVGSATHADWVLVGSVEPAVTSTRVELTAALMQLGRIESVAREIDTGKADAQVKEMLAVLIRPEGVGAGELPWERSGPRPPAPAAPPPSAPPPVPAPPPPPPLSPRPPDGQAGIAYVLGRRDVWPAYSAGNRAFIGAVVGASVPAARPSGASGSGASFTGALRGGYAIGDSGFEPFAELGANLVGPQALWVAGGARFLWNPTLNRSSDGGLRGGPLFLGPEALVGAFVRLPGASVTAPDGTTYSGTADAHPVLGAAFDLALALSPSFQLEAELGNLRWIPASGGSILLLGATLGASVRF